MTKLEMIKFIDEFLSQQEDLLHGIEGENCTKSRKYLEMLKKQLALCNVVGRSEQLVCSCGSKLTKTTGGYRCGNVKCSV